ncbi:hypothetical protein CDV31_002851 [Fusarium ambrosium]|uniref:Uncharacterized protein n=1 Tax=Fusarium ambrosium TaxID=131363 RepID=A0A428UVN6_9HYPO|nr:hypothetical protein CDV31_002851 [Fusarium ambrosium]
MDPTTRVHFLESPLYTDLKTAFQSILEEKIRNSPSVQQTEVPNPYYYITGLPLPFREGCWCVKSQYEQCRDLESCPCNAGWVPRVHGVLGWYGQPAEYCIQELVRRMSQARMDRYVMERPWYQEHQEGLDEE